MDYDVRSVNSLCMFICQFFMRRVLYVKIIGRSKVV